MSAVTRSFSMVCAMVLLMSGPALASAAGGDAHAFNWFDFSHWIGDNPIATPPVIGLLINFALVVWIVALILRAPMRNRFKTRRDELETAYKEATELKAAAEKAIAEARARREAIDDEMAEIRKHIREAGQADAARVIAEAEDRAERLRADTKAIIEHEIALYTQTIREQVVSDVVDAATKMLKDEMKPGDHERLHKEYIDSLGSSNSVAPVER